MPSKVFDRWLISSTDMPTPGSDTRSRCASSSTGSGRTAGPAEKLKTRWVVVAIGLSQHDELQIENIRPSGHPAIRPSGHQIRCDSSPSRSLGSNHVDFGGM